MLAAAQRAEKLINVQNATHKKLDSEDLTVKIDGVVVDKGVISPTNDSSRSPIKSEQNGPASGVGDGQFNEIAKMLYCKAI